MYSNFSQFGLYRYENGSKYGGNKSSRSFHSKIIICSIVTMSLIFCALVYVFINSRFVEPIKNPKVPRIKPREVVDEHQGRGIEVIEISGKNESDHVTKRIKRLDSVEREISPNSQKLIFFPSRTLKPPRISERPRVLNFAPANHRMSSRTSEPRPFNHIINGPKPNGFQSSPLQATARTLQQQRQQVQNIQDIIRHNQNPLHQTHHNQLNAARFNVYDPSTLLPVQLAGTYRNPRNNGELSEMLNPDDFQKYPTKQPDTLVTDPFYKFKPNSPYEINQMALNGLNNVKMMPTASTQSPYFRRKFTHQVASIPNYNIRSRDATGIYQNVLNSGRDFHVDRVEEPKKKPFSMMLDFYPMAGGANELGIHHQQQRQYQSQFYQPHKNLLQQQQHLAAATSNSPRLKPFQGYYQDPSLFNTMQFPQLTPRYPAYYRFNQPKQEASSNHLVGHTKPSQLVVHLNLFPKNKVPSFKRSSNDEQVKMRQKAQQEIRHETFDANDNNTVEKLSTPVNINFNVNTGNGHPENVLHQGNFSVVSTDAPFKPTYYYDDSDDDQSLAVAPSLVYHSIHRDRPIQLMLTNSTTTETPPAILKNHKLSYKTIERPRKRKIKNETRKYGNVF